jgi:hypothetical protein
METKAILISEVNTFSPWFKDVDSYHSLPQGECLSQFCTVFIVTSKEAWKEPHKTE